MQDTSDMLTRWAITLQNYDFAVKHAPGKLYAVPDMLSCAHSEGYGEPVPSEPNVAAFWRNVPIDGPHYPPSPREYELSASNLHDITPVESYSKLFMSAVSVFPTVDPVKLVDLQKDNFLGISSTSENQHRPHSLLKN